MLNFAKQHSVRKPFSTLSALKTKNLNLINNTKKDTCEKFKPLSEAQESYLSRVIRVNQAGELGANYIYAGQYFILANKFPHLKPVLRHMWDQEIHHNNTFNDLQLEKRVRPSLLTPLWKLGAFTMGSATALLSPEGAMACTEAVETVIGDHYGEQLRCLNDQFQFKNASGKIGQSNEIKSIISTIAQFRNDELEHLDTAIANNSHKAVPYILLTQSIKFICRTAIWTAGRI